MAVIRMVEAETELGSVGAEAGDLRRGETEMSELHRRGLVVVAARVLAIAFGDATDLLVADAQQNVVLDTAETFERGLAAHLVIDLEHHGGDKLVPLRDERIISAQLVLDLRLPALLDVEHLVDLMTHRRVVLQVERGEGTDIDLVKFDSLRDMHAGEGAFGSEELRRVLRRLLGDRSTDLECCREIALFDAPRAAMAGAALDHGGCRPGQETQHLSGFLSHVLRPRVAGDVERDATRQRGQTLGQAY